jgi:glycosyltransferase involved in cell wall biosynthesis
VANITKRSKISVVIPAFNEEKYLPMCLKSLQEQDFDGGYEVIVVDNNSDDDTAKVAASFGATVVREKRRGICFAREAGTEKAKGEIVVSTDADCTLPKDWLQKISDTFEKYPEIVAATGSFQFAPKPRWGKFYSMSLFKAVKHFYKLTGKILYTPASNFAFKKSVWEEIGGYNTALTQGGDENDLFKRLRAKGDAKYISNNCVMTSSRRLAKGLYHSLFISLIGFYLLDYYVAAKVSGKSALGHYPAYREDYGAKKQTLIEVISGVAITVLITALLIALVFRISPIRAERLTTSRYHRVAHFVKDKSKKTAMAQTLRGYVFKVRHPHFVKPDIDL